MGSLVDFLGKMRYNIGKGFKMVKMFKVKIKGLGKNIFGDAGVWLTEKELGILIDRQYDEKMSNKVVNMGGKFFRPDDFCGVLEESILDRVIESGSPLVDSSLLESLAKAGYLEELSKIDCRGYNRFVQKLVASGQYALESGEDKKSEANIEGLKKLQELKETYGVGEEI